MKRKPKLKLNMVLNAINGVLNIIFPLITFPYITKTLGVDAIGKINFSSSIISYFNLLAALGISAYAIREGSRLRNDNEQFDGFASQLYSINFISMLFSYLLLLFLILLVPTVRNYKLLLIIFSAQIFFITIGVDWIFTIFEDFGWMTLRKLIVKLVSLVLLVTFVKKPQDIYVYALISILADAGGYLFNRIACKKYCNIKFTLKLNLKKHINPVLVLFATSLSVSIFVNSDITILGFICGDVEVGVYSVAAKVYSIVKTILSSIIVASVPRLAEALGKDNKDDFNRIANDVIKTLTSVLLPSVIGIILLRKEIILIISNESYIEAAKSLFLLGIALVASLYSWFWAQCVLVPVRKEKDVLYSNIVSAIVNVFLNLLLMKKYGAVAAAFTTLVAEIICFVWGWIIGKGYVKFDKVGKNTLKTLIGCISIFAINYLVHLVSTSVEVITVSTIVLSVISYGIIEIAIKNEAIYEIYEGILNKVKTGGKK